MDKKISDLTAVQSIDPADISLLVHNNSDYQFSFATLLTYVSSNLSTGSVISFGTTTPQNNTGKNGDVFINTASGSFAQKLSGTWTIVYVLPSASNQADGTLLYGIGIPNNLTGKNGDSYIDTGIGTFYKKSADAWSLVFTMLNGPAGVKGDKGDTGTTGANGKSILNGNANPSNQDTGADGDFYINTNTWTLFGPKTAGVWGNGATLVWSEDIDISNVSGLSDALSEKASTEALNTAYANSVKKNPAPDDQQHIIGDVTTSGDMVSRIGGLTGWMSGSRYYAGNANELNLSGGEDTLDVSITSQKLFSVTSGDANTETDDTLEFNGGEVTRLSDGKKVLFEGDPSGGALPSGGTTGQVLAKASDTDQDVEWVDQTGNGFNLTTAIAAANVLADEAAAVTASLADYTMYKTPTGELRFKLPAPVTPAPPTEGEEDTEHYTFTFTGGEA